MDFFGNQLDYHPSRVQPEFLEACRSGNRARMRRLLSEHGRHIDMVHLRTRRGDTALHLACREGHIAIVESLLDLKEERRRRVDVNAENALHETPLVVAADAGHAAVVRRLLRARGLALGEGHGAKAVMRAALNGHYEAAQAVLLAMQRGNVASTMAKAKQLLSHLTRYVELAGSAKSARAQHEAHKLALLMNNHENIIRSIVCPGGGGGDSADATPALRRKSLRESVDELKESIECTICCEGYEDAKVYACSNDHWICILCLPRNARCPSCREDFNKHPPRRRVTCEKYLSMIREHLALVENAKCHECNVYAFLNPK